MMKKEIIDSQMHSYDLQLSGNRRTFSAFHHGSQKNIGMKQQDSKRSTLNSIEKRSIEVQDLDLSRIQMMAIKTGKPADANDDESSKKGLFSDLNLLKFNARWDRCRLSNGKNNNNHTNDDTVNIDCINNNDNFGIDEKLNSSIEFCLASEESPKLTSTSPIEKRWDPLGAASIDNNHSNDMHCDSIFEVEDCNDLAKSNTHFVRKYNTNSNNGNSKSNAVNMCKDKPILCYDNANIQYPQPLFNSDLTMFDNYDVLYQNYAVDNSSACAIPLTCGAGAAIIDVQKIKSLEEEQEILTTSLMALTTHFAQVQFRLRQIVEAPSYERDRLLKNLEKFAFRGIPQVSNDGHSNDEHEANVICSPTAQLDGAARDPINSYDCELTSDCEIAKERQTELIEQLKKQLYELEKLAYESGNPGILPQSIVLEKQKVIIDELKVKLNLNVNDADLSQLTSDDLRNQVDQAIGEIIGPIKMKEQLVTQLKTQITDLERFIAFLQCESEDSRLKAFDMINNCVSFGGDSLSAPSDYRSSNSGSKITTKINEHITNSKFFNKNRLNSSNGNRHTILSKRLDRVAQNTKNYDIDRSFDKKFELLPYNSYAAKKKAAEKSRSFNQFQSKLGKSDTGSGSAGLTLNNAFAKHAESQFTKSMTESHRNNNSCDIKHSNSRIWRSKNAEHTANIITNTGSSNTGESLNQKAHSLLDKAATVLHMFILSQFGCSSGKPPAPNEVESFCKNTLKNTNTGNHWGDIRAQLELDIQEIRRILTSSKFDNRQYQSQITIPLMTPTKSNNFSGSVPVLKPITQQYKYRSGHTRIRNIPAKNFNSPSSGKLCENKVSQITTKNNQHHNQSNNEILSWNNIELTTTIRRQFAVTLQKLIQHGLKSGQNVGNNLLVPFMGCFMGDRTADDEYKYNQLHFNEYAKSTKLKRHYPYQTERSNYCNYDDDHYDEDIDIDVDADNAIITNGDEEGEDVFDNEIRIGVSKKSTVGSNARPKVNTLGKTKTHKQNKPLTSCDVRERRNSCGRDNDDNRSLTDSPKMNEQDQMHAWELILEYYYIKNGESFNDAPARKLSQSFNLDICGSQNLSTKQSLLSSIGNIIAMHAPYKRSYNSYFKAFVCSALNCRKLMQWLSLIFQSTELIDNFYFPWSYVARTGFRDALRSIDQLTNYDFNLPVDLAVRQFANIKDVFM